MRLWETVQHRSEASLRARSVRLKAAAQTATAMPRTIRTVRAPCECSFRLRWSGGFAQTFQNAQHIF